GHRALSARGKGNRQIMAQEKRRSRAACRMAAVAISPAGIAKCMMSDAEADRTPAPRRSREPRLATRPVRCRIIFMRLTLRSRIFLTLVPLLALLGVLGAVGVVLLYRLGG